MLNQSINPLQRNTKAYILKAKVNMTENKFGETTTISLHVNKFNINHFIFFQGCQSEKNENKSSLSIFLADFVSYISF